MKIFLIPGLGYNHRIFENLKFPLPQVEIINWIEPEINEEIHDYARRFFKPFENLDDEIILIGHSMGGMMAQEIANFKTIKKIILISSIKSRKEMPWFFKVIKPLCLSRFFSKEFSIKTVKFWGANHGFETPNEIELFKSMVGAQSNNYLQWALSTLSIWHEPSFPNTTELIQIHGTNDKTFPFKLIDNPQYVIEKGSHVLVYKQGKRISEILNQEI